MGRLNLFMPLGILLVAAIPAGGQAKRQDVPFELYHGYLVVVKGSAGSLENLSFAVDTGTLHSVVDQRIAHKLGLKPVGAIEQLAVSHVVAMNRVLLPKLTWGGGTLAALNVLAFDLSPMSRLLGRRIDMLLGVDVLQQGGFQIDFESRKIHFGDDGEPEHSIPFEGDVPYPVAKIRIDGQLLTLLMDTGSDSLAVFADQLPNEGLLPRQQGRGRDLVGGVGFARIAAQQVLLGSVELRDAKVFLIPPMPESKNYDGIFAPIALGAPKIYFYFERRRFGWDERKERPAATSTAFR